MKQRLKTWQVVFLGFLIVGTIYILAGHEPEVYRTNEGCIAGSTTYNIEYKASKDLHEEIKAALLEEEVLQAVTKLLDEKGVKNYRIDVDGESIAKGNDNQGKKWKNNTDGSIINRGKIFGTTYNIKYRTTKNLHKEIKSALVDVDNALSMFNKHSIIRAFNENRDTVANEMFTNVFNLAQEVSAKTDGAFDITVAPLVNAWGFGFKEDSLPDDKAVKEMLKYIGYRTVALVDGKLVKENKNTMLDCSAIAKGYGCDAVARVLDDKGVKDYMIEIGGEVVTKGKNDKGTEWNIAISKPTEDATEHQIVIGISGRGMATSGNYRNYREENGKKFAHTIDPRTGYPVQHSLLSATVVAETCAKADAYATAFMTAGLDAAVEICKENDIEAYFIYAGENGEMKTFATDGFKKYIKQ
ncbi:MAG: FAD:protein FMN transferase [Bacteroidaceae bacterium]|nr:FAD:protein FMN transferase [Bacteroidaceae bacterium]